MKKNSRRMKKSGSRRVKAVVVGFKPIVTKKAVPARKGIKRKK